MNKWCASVERPRSYLALATTTTEFVACWSGRPCGLFSICSKPGNRKSNGENDLDALMPLQPLAIAVRPMSKIASDNLLAWSNRRTAEIHRSADLVAILASMTHRL